MRPVVLSLRVDQSTMDRLTFRAEAERRPVRTMAAMLLADALAPRLTQQQAQAQFMETAPDV